MSDVLLWPVSPHRLQVGAARERGSAGPGTACGFMVFPRASAERVAEGEGIDALVREIGW